MQEVVNHHRFEDVEFEIPLASSYRNGRMIAHDLATDHRHRFRLRRVDFTWHNTASRLIRW